jgi:ABC-type sugar transport system permease subunit
MEEKPRSVISNGIYYGLITGGAMIVFSLIMYLLDLYMNKAVNWIGYVFLIAGMIWGTLEYRKKYSNGFLTYGRAFSSCFWIGLFSGILATVYLFVFINFIHPGFISELLDQMRENIQSASPQMSEEQMEQAISMSSKFMSPMMMTIWGLVTYTALSAVIGLILAIFLKKEDPSLKATM